MPNVRPKSKMTERMVKTACRYDDKGQTDQAIVWNRRAAKLGDTSAQLNVGGLLGDLGGRRNNAEAVWWLRRLARSCPSAAWNLAIHYRLLGQHRWAAEWLARAASAGEEDAQDLLGTQFARTRTPFSDWRQLLRSERDD